MLAPAFRGWHRALTTPLVAPLRGLQRERRRIGILQMVVRTDRLALLRASRSYDD
jgi:hypothetical protein